MSRGDAVAAARLHVDSGAFVRDLARRVAIRTESQDAAGWDIGEQAATLPRRRSKLKESD